MKKHEDHGEPSIEVKENLEAMGYPLYKLKMERIG